ncbi:GNAT family N-acetyltransferase [Bdellovibrio sp. HCB337]|uniref:GNAT family N-acetyltransferase n=1 Tax=Bdellovibrio sp. HCB337 TaxID=3394358 RepID=UPI0039A50670
MLNTLVLGSLGRVSTTLHSMYQMRLNRIDKFKPKIEVYSEVGPFLVKTVSSVTELKEALNLRYQVFHREMIGKTKETGVDVDEFDFHCDHLVIVEKKTEKIVGTYRLNCSEFSKDFYSAREFNLSRILQQPGIKLELGRACIHKDYRRGVVISLLWRGIAEYMAMSNAQLLFGCASIKTENPRQAALLYKYFVSKGRIVSDYMAFPTRAYTMPNLDLWMQYFKNPLTEAEVKEVEDLLPPLCRAYLKIGAYIGGEPAWDAEFKCIDFLTILHREDLNRTLWKRYKLDSEES